MNPRGGTELQVELLYKYVDNTLLDKVQITTSVPEKIPLHPTKPNILWQQNSYDQPNLAPWFKDKDNFMNEGHAYIYINGIKNRIYSEWYHIEDEKLTQPINQIRVTLNANNRAEYVVNSRPIEAIGVIKNENLGNWYNNKK